MYIRKIKKRNGKTNIEYEYLHLVENVRTEEGPRQRLILNLGSIDIDPSQYQALAKRIEDIITGQQSFLEVDEKIEKYARDASRQIFKKQAEEINNQEELYKDVDINSIEAEITRSIGPEYVCDAVWEELGLTEFFTDREIPISSIPILKALVIGRLIDPGSERYTKEWVEKRSSLYELCGSPLRASLNSYYRASDKLLEVKDSLERYLSFKEKDLFSLREKIYLIDLTNTYFEGECKLNPLALYGHSKERRNDCKLITLGLLIDESGFAKQTRFFPGNQSDTGSLSYMVEEMGKGIHEPKDNERPTVVIDAGIGTEDNIKWLKDKGYHYIAVKRGDAPFDVDYSSMNIIREDEAKGTKIEVKRFQGEDEVYILCRSKKKEAKEAGMRTRVEKLFLGQLEYYKSGLKSTGRAKRYKRIIEMIGKLRERYPSASKLYDIDVIPETDKTAADKSLLAVDIIWKKKDGIYDEQIAREGSYILRTDRADLEDKEIWEIYHMLNRIEYSFKCMKSSLGLRPVFHQKKDRVNAHLFISVLAYHILHIIEYRLSGKDDRRSWHTICNVLRTHQRLTVSFKSKENAVKKMNFIRISTKLEPEHLEIYRMLNLSGFPLKRRLLNKFE